MRWIVDGMNVIGCRPDGWWRDRHAAMTMLVRGLERWAMAEEAGVTVVFERPPAPPITSAVITVAHAAAPAPNSADDEIVRLIASDPHPEQIVVATSDRALAERARSAHATVCAAERLRELIDPR
ncbi:RNA-binding protein [Mycobacterium sp. EPG1]|nr:RNA-binding protein [Mycobacterium sp. EPG1]